MVVQLLPPAEAAPVSQAGGRRDVIRVGTALKPGQRWSRHQLSAVCMDAPGTRFWVALRPGDKRSGAEVEIREFRQVCSEQIGSIRHQLAAFARIGVGGYVRDMVHVAGAGKLAVLMSTGEVLLYNDQSLSKDVNLSYVIATKSARVLAVKPPSAGQAAVLAVVSQTAPADIQLHLLEVFPVAGTPGVRLLATPWTIHQDASRFAASEPQFVRGAAWGDATLFLAHDSHYQAISPGPRTAAPRLTPEVRVVHENPRDSPAAVPAASPPAASASPPPSTSSSSSPTSSRAPAEPPPAAGAPLPRSALLAALPPLDAACSGGGWASGGGGRGQVLMLVQLGRGEAAGQLLRGDGEPDALPGSGSSLVLFQGCQPLALAAASLYLLVICATHISVLDRRDGSEVQRLALDLREKLLRSEPAGAKQQLLQRELRVAFSPCGASLLLGLRTQVLLLELLPLAQQVRQLLKQQQLQAAASLLEHADALRSSGEAGPGEAAGEAARSPTSRRSSSSWLQQAWGQLGLLLLHQRQLPAALAALGRCSTAHWQPAALLRLVPEHSHPWADELPEASFWGLAPPLGRCQQAHGDVPDGPGTMTHVTSHAASATVSPDSVSPNSPPPAASGDEPSPPAPQLPGQLPPGDLLHAPASASAGPGSEEGDQASSGSSRGECLWRLSSQECEELVQYLMAVRRVPGVVLADAIDSVLVLLLASLQDHAALARFAQEANKVVVDAVRDKLKRADELHTLALLLKSKGRAREAVDLWTRMLAPNGPGATGVPPAAQDHRAAEALAATLAEPALVPEPEVVLESLAGLAAQAGLCASALRVLTARDDLAVPDVIALLDRLGDGPDPCSLRWRFLLHRTGAPGPPVPRQYQDMLVLTLSHFLLRCEAARPERDRWLAALQPREDLDSLHAVLQRYLQTSCGFSKLLVRRQLQALCRQDGGSARMLLQLVAAHKRMGEDEAALLILALRVKDLPQAIQYCSTSRDDKLWLDLLEMLMDPEPAELRLAGLGLAGSAAGGGAVAAQQPMYAEACLLLSAPGANNLDPVKVLEKLDEGMPLCVAAATLERMAKGHIHRRRHARLALHLLKRVELQLKEKLWRERMRYVVFGGADGVSRCSGCGTSLTGSGIATGRVTVVPPPPAPISAAATAQKPCPQRIPELWCFACSQREGWRIPKENEFD